MPITFGCECGKLFSVADALAGKRTKCPACAAPLTVPTLGAGNETTTDPTAASPEEEAFRVLAEDSDDEGEPPPALARRDPDPAALVDPPPRSANTAPVPPVAKPRSRKRARNPDDQRWEGPRIHISPAVAGGLGSMALGGILFGVGLANNRVYFYAPVIFFFGLVAVVRGLLGYSED